MTAKDQPSTARRRSRSGLIDKLSIFIVDDHPVVRHGLARMIDRMEGFSVCGEAGTLSETMRAVRQHQIDVVVLDITLDDGSGLELLKQLQKYDASIKVIMVTMHDEEVYAERALQAGALGYVKKTEELDSIAERIRDVIQRKLALSPAMKERMMQHAVSRDEEESSEESVSDRLSDRELQVFEQIGKGLSTQEIADRLRLSVKTIDTHRERIRVKLGLRHRNDIIRHAVMWVERVIR